MRWHFAIELLTAHAGAVLAKNIGILGRVLYTDGIQGGPQNTLKAVLS